MTHEPRTKAAKVRRTEEQIEQIREQLDEYMLGNPNVAHIAQADPLSLKYRKKRPPKKTHGRRDD